MFHIEDIIKIAAQPTKSVISHERPFIAGFLDRLESQPASHLTPELASRERNIVWLTVNGDLAHTFNSKMVQDLSKLWDLTYYRSRMTFCPALVWLMLHSKSERQPQSPWSVTRTTISADHTSCRKRNPWQGFGYDNTTWLMPSLGCRIDLWSTQDLWEKSHKDRLYPRSLLIQSTTRLDCNISIWNNCGCSCKTTIESLLHEKCPEHRQQDTIPQDILWMSESSCVRHL